jgi:hypothetical protein
MFQHFSVTVIQMVILARLDYERVHPKSPSADGSNMVITMYHPRIDNWLVVWIFFHILEIIIPTD